MSTTAVVTMFVICSLVWGGFATLLWRAVGHENRKQQGAPEED